MLTKDLLIHRRTKDRIHPQLLDVEAPIPRELADRFVRVLESAVGRTRDAVAEALALEHLGLGKPKVAKGLVKLALDRLELEEPTLEVGSDRLAVVERSARVLRHLPEAASAEDYERALAESFDLEATRAGLYRDLPGARVVRGVRSIRASALLHRYNLAQVQGLALHAQEVQVQVPESSVLELRRVLRWLRFCRLVSRVERSEPGFVLRVEGPGRVVSASKKYGLQLAEFVAVVPVLARFELRALVKLRGVRPLELIIDQEDGLVSPHDRALGHVPEELQRVAETVGEHPEWRLETDPAPRHVGAKEMCVPDLALEHRRTGERFDVELFHRWHKAALSRRLEQLATRPEPGLILGIDRSIAVDEGRLKGTKHFRFRDFVRFEHLEPLLEPESPSTG